MSEFEHHDDELASALRRRAGATTGPVGVAHEAVLARAGLIRRRRAAVVGGTTMAALVVGGFLLLPRDGAGMLTPQDTGDVLPSIGASTTTTDASSSSLAAGPTPTDAGDASRAPTSGPTSTSGIAAIPGAASTTVESATSDAASTTAAVDTVAGGATTAPAATVTTPSSSVPVTTPTSSAGPPPTDDTTTTSADNTTTDAPAPAPFTETYDSPGGSITVNWDGSRLSLLSVAPASGFSAEVKDDDPDRVRVEFDDGDTDWRIDVRFTGDDVTVEVS